MRYRQYKFKFYINASHAIYIGGKVGERHPHTWEIVLSALKIQQDFVQFDQVEQQIDEFIEHFQGRYMNEISPFDLVNPTLENCCEYFKDQIGELLRREGWLLLMIEMSETPTRSYVINLLDESGDDQSKDLETLADAILNRLLEE